MKKINNSEPLLITISPEGIVKIRGKEIEFDPLTALLILATVSRSAEEVRLITNQIELYATFKEK